ncbi:MAG: bifunctional oligoribonuclease/PAP phosphatase NrnA, partial [Moorea sp. SIO3H5]|nr:bifunctional oligoribonuclease/PAP phosphatase NrnA [Moorena sp. SIO3H5]
MTNNLLNSGASSLDSEQVDAQGQLPSTQDVNPSEGNSQTKRRQSATSASKIYSKVQQLQETLERHQNDRQLVILQDFPDPDALSSAWAYQLIAEQYNIQCDIVYAGTLSHQENIALVKLTGLPTKRWSVETTKNQDLSVYQGYVLIDNQGTTTQLLPIVTEANIPLIAIFDHHSSQGELK